MPDITKQPYKNMIKIYTKLKVFEPDIFVINIINIHNIEYYKKISNDWKQKQTGGGNRIINLNGNEFDFNSYHSGDIVFYNLLDSDGAFCLMIEINKSSSIAYIQGLQSNKKYFDKHTIEKKRINIAKGEFKIN